MDKGTQLWFEKLACDGTWPSRYGPLDYTTYNFICRRNAVKQLLKKDSFLSVLDLGCGTGDYIEALPNSTRQYVGVDFSYTMLKKAKSKYIEDTSTPVFVTSCAEKLPFKDNAFDLILAIGLIEYFKEPMPLMHEIVRVLKPGGTLIMQSWQLDFYKRINILNYIHPILRRIKGLLEQSRTSKEPGTVAKIQVDIPYTKDKLDRFMKKFGFHKTAFSYNNFNIFPYSVRKVFPKAYITLSEAVSHSMPNFFRSFSVNYIGRYMLDKDPVEIKTEMEVAGV